MANPGEELGTNPCDVQAIEDKISREPGEEATFQQVFDCYYGRVRGYFARRLRDPEVVQDLTQTAFLGLHRGLQKQSITTSFEAYLFTILRNTFLKHLERRRRRPPEESLIYEDNVSPVWSSPPQSVEEETLRQERRRVLWRAIEALPERKRQCVVLHYGQGLSYQEIAQILRVRGGTVAATLHQARGRLQEELAGHFDASDFVLAAEGSDES